MVAIKTIATIRGYCDGISFNPEGLRLIIYADSIRDSLMQLLSIPFENMKDNKYTTNKDVTIDDKAIKS